jgi:hypothetical protein
MDMEFNEDDADCQAFIDNTFPEKSCISAGSLCLDTYGFGIKRVCVYQYTASTYILEAPVTEPEPEPEPEPAPVPIVPLSQPLHGLGNQQLESEAKASPEDHTQPAKDKSKPETHTRTKIHKKKKERPLKGSESVHTAVDPNTTVSHSDEHNSTGHNKNKTNTKHKTKDNKFSNLQEAYINRLRNIPHVKHKSKRTLGASSDTLTINQLVFSELGGDNLYNFVRLNLIWAIQNRLYL